MKYEPLPTGIYVDCSAQSANTLNARIIAFAQGYGFALSAPLPPTSDELDYSEALHEESERAVDYLNSCESRKSFAWFVDDNSLFLSDNSTDE